MKYINRQGKTLTFQQEGSFIRIRDHESEYLRILSDREGGLQALDFPGGPYLYIGMQLGTLLEDLKEAEIVSISVMDSEIRLQVRYNSILEKDI